MPTAQESRQRAKDERLQAHKLSDNEYRVYNPTSKSAYSVIKSPGGTWYCTCPYAVKGSRIGAGICKHLQRVTDKENGCISCHVQTTLVEGKCSSCRWADRFNNKGIQNA